jgi:hypothetical protein
MSLDSSSLDLIRWTFTVNPEHRAAIESHLADLGLEVLVQDDSRFIVSWEEPGHQPEEVIEELWELNGATFEVTQEEFHRFGLHIVHHDEQGVPEAA